MIEVLPSSALDQEISTLLLAILVLTLVGAAGFCAAKIVRGADAREKPTEFLALTWN